MAEILTSNPPPKYLKVWWIDPNCHNPSHQHYSASHEHWRPA